ncbi:YgaP family membrane protein [Kaarinaea lacus]
MSKTFLDKNMCKVEAGMRFILGAIPLSIIMLNSSSETWIALLAVYPIITAIMAWDPFYAVINSLISIVKKPSQEEPSILPAG